MKRKTSIALNTEIQSTLDAAAVSYGTSRSKIAETEIAFFLAQPEAVRICAITNQLDLEDQNDEQR